MSRQHRKRDKRPTDPFKPLGNETRLEILRTLYDHRQTVSVTSDQLPYSTLRERVGVEDKGNFNYHLRQLREQFIEEGPDGYRLTFAGFEIAKVIDMDAWRSHEERGPVSLANGYGGDGAEEAGMVGVVSGETDSNHDTSLTAVYEDSVVKIRRGEATLFAHAVRPAGAAGREMSALLEVASTLWRHTIEQILEGICPYCHTTVERSLTIESDGPWEYSFAANCPECGSLGGSHVGTALLNHPAVVSFYWDHGIDVRDRRFWEFSFIGDEAVTVLDEEPLELRIDLELDGDQLAVVIDDDVCVVDTDRSGSLV
ncbi:winged helix-turn-helix domain-containing protein [Halostagnicola sp. A-GB9-2]|uniref:winged helix-turn-helix domain-containing protein n=1 Tax=Halostagnicola sp. A-GB9-2 TaxID=3048066 RepID=UPI0024BFC0A9|nr:winged helix-turn-helix domain-containing protein [Halostagnicola sp. A-GB9-2]MDJ1431096.1 winged helix-turn-helix domain-containing protein [Halostagnicola sp. A-GB9-2]